MTFLLCALAGAARPAEGADNPTGAQSSVLVPNQVIRLFDENGFPKLYPWLVVNGTPVNECYNAFPSSGKILLESEGFEILFRKFELHPLKEPAFPVDRIGDSGTNGNLKP